MGEGPEAEFLRQYREAVEQAMALHAGVSLGPSLVDLPLEAGFSHFEGSESDSFRKVLEISMDLKHGFNMVLALF